MTVRVLIGDIRDRVAEIPDGSVDLVFTSSPFWRLRAYLLAGHPLKGREIGTEATPGEFIDALLDVVELLEPKLAAHGSMMWELGDTMAGSGGVGGDYQEGGQRDGQPLFDGTAQRRGCNAAADGRATGGRPPPRRSLSPRPKYSAAGVGPATQHTHRDLPGWPLEKSLCLIPEIFRFALVYGFNPLTGRETPRWRARNVVRWARNNPVAGSLGRRDVERGTGDARYRPATTDLVVICRGRGRYFDLDAVRSAPKYGVEIPGKAAPVLRSTPGQPDRKINRHGSGGRINSNPAGAPPLDHWWHDDDRFDPDTWLVNTRPFKGAHFATMPVDLPVIPIKSMCPERVCTRCGRPSERVTTTERNAAGAQSPYQVARKPGRWAQSGPDVGTVVTTLGWSECGCGDSCRATTWHDLWEMVVDDDGEATGEMVKVRQVDDIGHCHEPDHWRAGMVLDPFGGAGTTAVAAQRLGRDCTLVDVDERNAQLVHDRIAHDLVLPDDVAVVPRAQLDLFSIGSAAASGDVDGRHASSSS